MKNPLPFFRNLLGRAAPLLVVLPGTLMFLLFTFIPMVYCFVGSFAGGKGPLDLYVKFLTSRYFRDLLFTVGVGIATATISFFVSIPAAMMLRGDFRGKSVVQALLLFPMVVPELIAGYAMWLTLMPHGFLYTLVEVLTGYQLPRISDWTKLVIACVWKYFPIMTLLVASGLEGIDPDLELAARGLGASATTTFLRVTLPLLIPSLLSGYTLVLLRAAGQFSITLVVGGARLTTIPIDVWYQYQMASLNFAYVLATALTFTMVGIVMLLTRVLRGLYHA